MIHGVKRIASLRLSAALMLAATHQWNRISSRHNFLTLYLLAHKNCLRFRFREVAGITLLVRHWERAHFHRTRTWTMQSAELEPDFCGSDFFFTLILVLRLSCLGTCFYFQYCRLPIHNASSWLSQFRVRNQVESQFCIRFWDLGLFCLQKEPFFSSKIEVSFVQITFLNISHKPVENIIN